MERRQISKITVKLNFKMEKFDFKNMTTKSLSELPPDQLYQLIFKLKEQNDELIKSVDKVAADRYEARLENIERQINLDRQYLRRDSIEISGIPLSVPDDEIEAEVLKIVKQAKAKVGNRYPGPFDVQAAHRKNKKGVVICKFLNRKFAETAIRCGSNLKDVEYKYTPNAQDDDAGNTEPHEGSHIYINESLCPEFNFLHFAVRQSKKKKEVHRYQVRKGVMSIQREENGRWIEISHVNDLCRNNLTVPPRLKS